MGAGAESQPREPVEMDSTRRDFLKAAGVAGAAAAAVAAVPDAAEAQEFPPDEPVKYELTPHVERFYSLNRL